MPVRDNYQDLLRCLLDKEPHNYSNRLTTPDTYELHSPETMRVGPIFFRAITCRPGGSYLIGVVEGIFLSAGRDPSRALLTCWPKMESFADDGVFRGNPGPIVARQIEPAIKLLTDDIFTRRAHIAMYADEHLYSTSKNIPCGTGISFSRRYLSRALDMHVQMRSNDVWRGFTYDAIAYRYFQEYIAARLGEDMCTGDYHHTATSMHLYKRDTQDALSALADEEWGEKTKTGDSASYRNFNEILDRVPCTAQGVSNLSFDIESAVSGKAPPEARQALKEVLLG